MTTPRPAPISFRPNAEHKRLIDEALALAGITKRQKFWFPRLMTELLTSYNRQAKAEREQKGETK